MDADALLHRLLFDFLQGELAEWPSPRVLELLQDVEASDEEAGALRVRAVQMQGEFFVAWARGPILCQIFATDRGNAVR